MVERCSKLSAKGAESTEKARVVVALPSPTLFGGPCLKPAMSHWVAIRHVVSNAFRGQRALLKAQWRRTVSTVNVPDANAQTDSDEYLRLVFDDKYVWNQHCANSAHSPAVGLLGNPNFANVEGFEYAAKQAIQRSQIIVERIWRAPENGPEEMRRVVKNLDRLSDTLCSVIDMAEFIRNAHPGPEVMEAANKAYMDLCYYMNILNTDTRMHKVRHGNTIH